MTTRELQGSAHAAAPSPTDFQLRALRIPEDMPLIHSWVSREYAGYWGMRGQSLAEVTSSYRTIVEHADVYLGRCGSTPAFLMECYEPSEHVIGRHYAVEPGDRGMHVLLAPPDFPRHGFSWAVFRAVLDFLFNDERTRRIIVEPDVRNHKIHALNRRAGFRYQKLVSLPNKLAHLAFCSRENYASALRGAALSGEDGPAFAVDQLSWRQSNSALVRKTLAEFCHELLLAPELERADGAWGHYRLEPQPGVRYRFAARVLPLEHWDIELESLRKTVRGEPAALDALELVLELQPTLQLKPDVLEVYLEEIANTLYAGARARVRERANANELLHAGFQELEGSMREGHPAFVANNGRVGFDARDVRRYAPEAGAELRLVWLAARRTHTEFNAIEGLTYESLLLEELGSPALARIRDALLSHGVAPQDYSLIPAHPWQWTNRLAATFAPDLAKRDLIYLGLGEDRYQAQQSIRTLCNVSRPHQRYVKTALSVLNMGFVRGLSVEYMRVTPAINAYLDELLRHDSYLAGKGFALLREVAACGYRSPYFERLPKTSPQRKMLAALWRESPVPRVGPRQRLMTMAALLHRDRDGRALLPILIRAAGLSVDAWLRRYLDCYLAPLLHCFYAYDLAFMPHGENVILVIEENIVVGTFIKDLAEEAVFMDAERTVPPAVSRLCVAVPEELKPLAIFTDVFDGIFRYLAQILLEQAEYPPDRFWSSVRDCVLSYQRANPQLSARFAREELFTPEFKRSCLNRLQLKNNFQMLDLADPTQGLAFAGSLKNPICHG